MRKHNNIINPPSPPFIKGGTGGILQGIASSRFALLPPLLLWRAGAMTCILIAFLLASCSGCPGCGKSDEPVQIGSKTMTLQEGGGSSTTAGANKPRVRVINIGPSKKEEGEAKLSGGSSAVPSEVTISDSLTSRLKEKLKEAFEGRGSAPPEIEIYTGVMSLDAFAKYYEDKGHKIQRTSVPSSQIVAPLLDEKPELSGKINLSNYAGVNINQVVVEGANISAADKYIDPETYEIVYKTFVTVTK